MNFRLRGPVILAFRLADQGRSHCIPNLDGVLSLRVEDGNLVGPGTLGCEVDFLAE